MSQTRVIKKYPNRRLYDTEESRYITLAAVKDLVMNKVDFEVIDKKSGEDITRTILLQVISEQEQQGDAIMSEDFLAQIIRAYGSVVPDFVTKYLEQSMTLFMQQQKILKGQLQSAGRYRSSQRDGRNYATEFRQTSVSARRFSETICTGPRRH